MTWNSRQNWIRNTVDTHKDKFSELSFRTIAKLVDLWKFKPERWERLAKTSMFSQSTTSIDLMTQEIG